MFFVIKSCRHRQVLGTLLVSWVVRSFLIRLLGSYEWPNFLLFERVKRFLIRQKSSSLNTLLKIKRILFLWPVKKACLLMLNFFHFLMAIFWEVVHGADFIAGQTMVVSTKDVLWVVFRIPNLVPLRQVRIFAGLSQKRFVESIRKSGAMLSAVQYWFRVHYLSNRLY